MCHRVEEEWNVDTKDMNFRTICHLQYVTATYIFVI